MPTATINGFRLDYDVTGSGPPLLFIHGGFGGISSTLTPRNWEWSAAITDAYTFIQYDRRAAGRSAYPDKGYDLPTFAADARELLRHLGMDAAFVMGDSAGGPIALTFALTYPEATPGLALAETGARLLTGAFSQRLRTRIDVLERHGPEAAYVMRKEQGSVGLQEHDQSFSLPPDQAAKMARAQEIALERLKTTTRAERVRWYAGELRNYSAYLDVDLHPRLAEIHCPTLVIHGDRDRLVPYELGVRLAAAIARAELATIASAEHGVMYFPGAVDALRDWLDRQTRRSTTGHTANTANRGRRDRHGIEGCS
jgi:pimeloyl-ACP methyl ester carboxylesterase